MNGLSEALLEEIANELRIHTDVLKKMAEGSGSVGTGPPSGGAASSSIVGGGFKLLGSAVGGAAGLIGGVFSTALGVASSGLRTLTTMGTQLFQAQMALAESTRDGTGTLSSFYDSLSDLPFGLGLLARVLSYHTKVLETNLATFQKMSQSGATLGGNLDMVRQSAKGMYLSMDEFANVMQANVGVIRMLGGTVDEGAKNLIKFNTQLIQGNVGRQLLGMGHTIEEVNTMLASYASIVGGVRDEDFKNQRRMEQSVKSFAVELDLAAQLEGKTRKQKEDELKKAADQAAVQAMLAGMSAENQDKYLQALADAESRGQGAVDLLHSQLLGLPPMTEAAQLFYSMNNQAAEAVKRNADIVNDNTTHLQARGELDRNRARADAATLQTYERMGQTGQALTFSMDATGQAVRDMAVSAGNAKKIGVETEEQGARRIAASREAIARAGESQAGAVAQAAGRAKYQGEELMAMLYGLFKPLEPVLLGIVSAFQMAARVVIPFATRFVNEFLIPLFNDLFGDISLSDITKPFRDFFQGLFGEGGLDFRSAAKAISSFIKPMMEFFGSMIGAVDWKGVGTSIRQGVIQVFDILQSVGNWLANAADWEGIASKLFDSSASYIDWMNETTSLMMDSVNWKSIGDRWKTGFDSLTNSMNNMFSLFSKLAESPATKKLQDILVKLFGFIIEDLTRLWEIITGLVEIIAIYLNDHSRYIEELFDQVITAIDGVIELVQGIFEFITGDFSGGWELMKSGLGKILKSIQEMIYTLVDWVSEFVEEMWEKLKTAISSLFNYIWEGVKDLASSVKDYILSGRWLVDIPKAIGQLFTNILDSIRSINFKEYIPGTAEYTARDARERAAQYAIDYNRYLTGAMSERERNQFEDQYPDQKNKWNTVVPASPTTPASTAPATPPAAAPVTEEQRERRRREAGVTGDGDGDGRTGDRRGGGTSGDRDASRRAGRDNDELNTSIATIIQHLSAIQTNTGNAASGISGLGNLLQGR